MSGFEFIDAFQAYLLGNFQGALKVLQRIRSPDENTKLKIDVLTYRIYIAQKKYGIVLDEVPEDTECIELKLLRIIALFFTNPSKSSALSVQCLLSMHRYDLAGKAVRRMQVADEDALPCQLATALYYLTKGGEQLQEALHIYEELREKHGPTSVILNGQAIALIGMNRWEEAETVLLEALDLTVSRLISQLKESNKDHPFLVDQLAKAEEFTRCAQQYAPTVPD
ncbi:Coatomer subunit epsilon [Fasciola gigantica]|uniref:Coatomer subunit epsilon n=1 Tax=Fasciola gigantica TaxID=46835 RepID=A0A504Y7R2_FASGI|nr:Coatomer subunit epsilon [Fasciola gigantica]